MKIVNVIQENICSCKICDYYVPVRVRYESNKNGNGILVNYRLINKFSSFLEMSIDSVTGKLIEIAMVSINNVDQVSQQVFQNVPCIVGNPIIEVDISNNKYIITKDLDYKIFLLDKKIVIMLDNVVYSKILMENLAFYTNIKNEVIGYEFYGFSDEEWEEIKVGVEANIKVY